MCILLPVDQSLLEKYIPFSFLIFPFLFPSEMQVNVSLPSVKMPGMPGPEFERLKNVERKAASMPSHGRSLYPVEMLDDLMRDAGVMRERDHAQLQDAVSTMRATIPKRNWAREPPGFERNDPFLHHVPRVNVPTRAVPHTCHEALNFRSFGVYPRQNKPKLPTVTVSVPEGLIKIMKPLTTDVQTILVGCVVDTKAASDDVPQTQPLLLTENISVLKGLLILFKP